MSAPDRIYIHTGDCDDTYYELSDCCDDEVDYIRTDIHEAEITALKAEIAALKAPPKVLKAGEVTEPGFYCTRDKDGHPWTIAEISGHARDALKEEIIGSDGEFLLQGQYVGPLKMPEV